MTAIDLTRLVVLVLFGANSFLLIGLFVLKTIHRRRIERHNRRRSEFTRLISRHLTYEHCTDPITPAMSEDPAFLD
ncbi:MAG: hypothetical protein KY394_06735, partial [Actinobacteria bacterium]|nr:hypothetical protein [Actinomycetota bacterium]